MTTINENADLTSDDFDKLLDEFISSSIEDDSAEDDASGKEDDGWDEEEDDDTSDEEEDTLFKEDAEEMEDFLFAEEDIYKPQIVAVELAYVSEGSVPEAYSERTVFRYNAESRMAARVRIHNPYYGKSYHRVEGWAYLRTEQGDVLQEVAWQCFLGSDEVLPVFTLDFNFLSSVNGEPSLKREGLYRIEILDKQKSRLFEKIFQLVQLPESFTSCFSYNAFNLYRIDAGKEVDYQNLPNSQNCFHIKNLGSILMVFLVNDLLEKEYPAEFEIKLYNETGQLVKANRMEAFRYCLEDGKGKFLQLVWTIGEDEKNFWNKQIYLIEILFMGETVISAPFEVGVRDTEALYGKDSIQPKTHIAGKKIVKADSVDSPMEQLDKMIGLQRVKNQIRDYSNIITLARKRSVRGMETPLPSLHGAFIGNPGTGKTTVAKLFGAILKELGVLSKGHVVFEERSTLTGQFYSSEHEKTLKAMERAKGGILFIDEAYTLYKPNDPKDPGMQVLETLLTALADEEQRDWMLLLAGYPEPMNEMLAQNPGFDSRIPPQNRYYFDDYNVEELMQIADLYCENHHYVMTPEARKALQLKVKRDYAVRDSSFGNGRYIENLLSMDVLQAISSRVNKLKLPSMVQLSTIEVEDIPQIKAKDYKQPLAKLRKMVGLGELKKSIESHLNMVRFASLRAEMGIHTEMPPLHMIFTGNPGTGKTTVADLIGEIYASLGLLSVGNVIRVERSDLIGVHIGDTEKKTKGVLQQARGNVLFIDEAYTLYSPNKEDYGNRVLETLLTALSREEVDMLVILAGYPEEMNLLLETNSGLKSRFPYTFYFQDYSVDELMEIAQSVAHKSHYCFSPAALRSLKQLIASEVARKDKHFGNARFVTRLISAHIIPAMSNRLAKLSPAKLKNKKVLQTICKEDISLCMEPADKEYAFDEKAIARSLRKLDKLVGLEQVKQGIRNFVEIARYLNRQGKSYDEMEPLRWNFTGNTGTGKSTVAGILAELLKAMNMLGKGHLVEVKAEELYNVSEYKVDELLRDAMRRSCQGLLFVDGDAPQFKNPNSYFDGEKLRIKLGTLMAELPGPYALVIAGYATNRQPLVDNLQRCGIPEFDHTFHFADYSEEELFRILELCLKERQLVVDEGAGCILKTYIHGLCSRRELGYANARTMKLLSRSVADMYLLRASKENASSSGVVRTEDVSGFVWNEVRATPRIGYK